MSSTIKRIKGESKKNVKKFELALDDSTKVYVSIDLDDSLVELRIGDGRWVARGDVLELCVPWRGETICVDVDKLKQA